MTTRYRFDVECDDLGEYDALFVRQVAAALTWALCEASTYAYRLTVKRDRGDE